MDSTQRLQTADIVALKYAARPAIITAGELAQLLTCRPAGHPMMGALGCIAAQIMRPAETVSLNWRRSFVFDADRIIIMRHLAYKARNRVLASMKTKVTYLVLEKPMFSQWLSEMLLRMRQIHAEAQGGAVFPWSCSDSFGRFFSQLRREAQLPFILEPCTETLVGEDKTQYRVSPYSLRRFAFTYHYWVTFNQDIVALSRFAGHADVRTTWGYVYPYESIGLTQAMIDAKISWDELVFGREPGQQLLAPYLPGGPLPIPHAPGQRQLGDYLPPSDAPCVRW